MTGRPTRERRGGGLRIAAGRWKGRRLEVPAGARPTSGRAREALFDILQKRLPSARLLDLYAGSGAVGLEAASRGAARSVLVEPSAAALDRNVAKLAPPAGAIEVLRLDAEAALRELARREERFEIVFADPPYAGGGLRTVLDAAARLLTEAGVLVVQSDAGVGPPEPPAGLRRVGAREYGRNVFWFLEREESPSPLARRRGAF